MCSSDLAGSRPDNLWIAVRLYDDKGNVCGQEDIAGMTDDRKTPAMMTDVRFPLKLLVGKDGSDASKIKSVGLYWGDTHSYNDRRCRALIERIALTD